MATAAYDAGAKLTSVVASAAYRSGETLRDERAGKTFDYTSKEDVLHTEILTPAGVPAWAQDRQALWNQVEASEKRKDARLARSIIAALPRELAMHQNVRFVREFVQEHFVAQGMVADVAVHDKDASDGGRNPHVHIMLTTRAVGPEGFAAKKNRDWNRQEWLLELRAAWEDMQNRYLEAAGAFERVSLESYEARRIDKLPGEHMGPTDWHKERRGMETDRGNHNRAIKHENVLREALPWRQPENRADSAPVPGRSQENGSRNGVASERVPPRAGPVQHDPHNRALAAFLRDSWPGRVSRGVVEHMQRMTHYVTRKTAAIGQQLLDRAATWTGRVQSRDREESYER